MDFLHFGRETVPAGASTPAPPIFIPFISGDEERCELCGEIKAREAMAVVALDVDDGSPCYACAAHLIEPTAFDIESFIRGLREQTYG
jgi:hypothetical protein